VAPLVPADDAIVIDTGDLSIDKVYELAMQLVHDNLSLVTSDASSTG
jgi:cytidylate kinase